MRSTSGHIPINTLPSPSPLPIAPQALHVIVHGIQQISQSQSGPQGMSMHGWPGFLILIGFAVRAVAAVVWLC